MGFLNGPKIEAPPPPPPPPPAANPPTVANAAVGRAGAGAESRAREAAGMGFSDTIKTSPRGLVQPATTAVKSLLGG